jgi:hypothetical protein
MGAALLSSACVQSARDSLGVTVEIGGIPILLQSSDADFRGILEKRYAGFVNQTSVPACQFKVYLELPLQPSDEDARVRRQGFVWHIDRGDFHAEWDTRTRRGWVRQSANPYAIDTVLRIAHSLVLAEEGGFLIHAASAARRGCAFLFAGVSGAGKTTISRLAPADATLLTDEVSYVRRTGAGYRAYGTPFAGELARLGANVSAPLKTVFLLEQGSVNRVEKVEELAAARALLRHILFFAHDPELVKRVFDSALRFASQVRVSKLIFKPEASVWDLIG